MNQVNIEIVSVVRNKNAKGLADKKPELKERLDKYGYTLTDVRTTVLRAGKIKAALNDIAKSENKPDVVIIANALSTTDSKSFRKYFVSAVAQAEHSENEPTPKKYWKERNKAFADAKKRKAPQEELDELEERFKLHRKKSKVFKLGEFGNGYKGYCFMFKGMQVAALPQASLTGENDDDVISLAAVRTKEVFENSAEDYPNGFSIKDYVPERTDFAYKFIPMRGDSGKEVARKCVVIVSFLVFLAALALLLYNMVFLSMKNAALNGEIQKIAHGVDDSGQNKKPDKGDEIDWDKLKKINKEIVGWIQMDNSQIDYPVLWHKGDSTTYQYYLSHNYKGDYDSFGSIFLDYRCTEGTDSKNIVMHGHHMNDGSMFGDLLKFGGTSGDLDYYKKTPTIEFDTPDGNATYKIISVFKTNTLSSQGEFFNYMVGNFQNEKDFMNYVYNVRVRSLFNCPVDVNENDKLITLSTCSYEFTNFRTVVVARKVRVGESKNVDVKRASLNSNAVWPQVYYSSRGGTRPKVTDFCTAYESGQIDWYNGDYSFKNQKVAKPASSSSTTSGSSVSNNQSSQVQPTTQAKIYLTVRFLDYDGSVLTTQKVEYGKAAKAPKNPTKPSDEYYDYKFKKWQLDYSHVTCNMDIAPSFTPVLKPQYTQAQ